MVKLRLKTEYDESLVDGDTVLGFQRIRLLFNVGPFPGGGDCLIVEADGRIMYLNSNDVIHDLDAYDISAE